MPSMKTIDRVNALLKAKNLKVTVARQDILSLFFDSKKPLHVGDLKKKNSLKEVNESSLYRNIQKLIEADIIQEVPSSGDFKLYEIIAANKHHHHIACTKCKEVQCLTDCTIGHQLKAMAAKIGFEVSSHSLELFGLCPKCQ